MWIVAKQPLSALGAATLSRALRSAGLRDEDVGMTSVMTTWSRDPAERMLGIARLSEALRTAKPSVIVPLGDEAFNAMLHMREASLPPVEEGRGYLWETPWGGKIMPTIDPDKFSAPIGKGRLEHVPWRVLLDLDLQKAQREAAERLPLPTYEVRLITSARDAQHLFADIQKRKQSGVVGSGGSSRATKGVSNEQRASSSPDGNAALYMARGVGHGGGGKTSGEYAAGSSTSVGGSRLVALDIENHEDMTLACLGIALEERSAWVLPTPRLMAPWQRSTLSALCALNVPKVFQNGGYDRYFLRKFYQLDVRGHAFDTMLAWHALQPELAGKTTKPRGHRRTAKSLRFLASIYTRAPFWKDYAFSDEMERYELCAKDCCVTLEVANRMREELDHA